MPWPIVSRERYDEAIRIRDSRIANLEKELHRWLDIISKHHFGAQIFDTLAAESKPAPEPEPELTAEQEIEKQLEDERAQDKRRLASISRHSPSRLGAELQRVQQKDIVRRAAAAHGMTTPAKQVFARAKEEALRQ